MSKNKFGKGCLVAVVVLCVITVLAMVAGLCSTKDNNTSDSTEVASKFKLSKDYSTLVVNSIYNFSMTKDSALQMETKRHPYNVLVSINLNEPVALYETEGDGSELKSNEYYYLGYSIRQGWLPLVSLQEANYANGQYQYTALRNHPLRITFTQKQLDYLNDAIKGNYKTQIKPIDYGDLVDYIDTISIQIQNAKGKETYKIPSDDKAFDWLTNGIFHESVFDLKK